MGVGLLVGAVAGAAMASAVSRPSQSYPPASYGQPPPAAPQSYPCSRCNYALTWVAQYGRWYCNYCRMYW